MTCISKQRTAIQDAVGRPFTMRRCKHIFVFACVVAVVAQQNLRAQLRCATQNDTDSGCSIEQPVFEHFDDGPNFDQPFAVGHSATSPIVTLHQLHHHVPRRATKEYEHALKAADKGDNEAAIGFFKRAIAVDPEFCAAFNGLGTIYLNLYKADLAEEQFNNAISADPGVATPYSNLAIAYLMKNRYADAERASRRAIDLNRGATHGLLMLGVSLILQTKFTEEAERSLTRAAGDFPQANMWHAVWLAGRGDLAEAEDQLKTYIVHADNAAANTATELLQRFESLGIGK